MKIFEFKSYRKFLYYKAQLLKNMHGENFRFSIIAARSQVQASYLTKVFKEESHLNQDQLYLILEYLKMTDRESNYISLLYDLERSSIVSRRRKIKAEIRTFREECIKAENHLSANLITDISVLTQQYFLSPKTQLLHLFLGIQEFRNDTGLILARLDFSKKQFDESMSILTSLNLIKIDGEKIVMLNNHLFLSKDSHISSAYHALMKANAQGRLNGLSKIEKYGLSVSFNSDRKTFDIVRSKCTQLLKEIETIARTPKENTEVFQLSIDFFPWT